MALNRQLGRDDSGGQSKAQYVLVWMASTINEERAQQIDFTVPYLTSQQFMLVSLPTKSAFH